MDVHGADFFPSAAFEVYQAAEKILLLDKSQDFNGQWSEAQ